LSDRGSYEPAPPCGMAVKGGDEIVNQQADCIFGKAA
jgi:hypothetical protein